MKYEKPQLFVGGSALAAIEGSSNKRLPIAPDAPHSGDVATSAAYEADE